MMRMSDVAQATGGILKGDDSCFDAVSTDTRETLAGKLFVALRGERFDAHSFLVEASAQGAAGAMVENTAHDLPAGFPVVAVDDTRLALGMLAASWRSRFDLPLIGVTGSNGKTTVKEMCAAILRAEYATSAESVLATQGNLNNDIGVPQMLLRLRGHHRAAVIEMGMNRPGEIAYLAGLAAPTVAVVTNAQRAHLAGMGALEAVASEKGALFSALGEKGVAVINADDPHCMYWQHQCSYLRVLTFGFDASATVRVHFSSLAFGSRVILTTPEGEVTFQLDVPGVHNVRNAAAAAAATLAAGVSLNAVARGLDNFSGAKGRLQVRQAKSGAIILDDTYNANPDSVMAAIDVLAASTGRKILVLGDMGEIGEMSAQYHDEIGGYAKSQGIDRLFALGEHSALAARNFGAGGEHFDSVSALVDALEPALASDLVVLIKGSRFMRMERVADAISASPDYTYKA